jgi:propanol-preferring alcohol dehydrogenase
MKAWVLKKTCDLLKENRPLVLVDMPVPVPASDEILIRISCCGVCHTELDEIEGRTPPPSFPMVLGHQVVGHVEQAGAASSRFQKGDRVGVAWIFSACGECDYCAKGLENLCEQFQGTGRDAFGGYAEYMTVREKFAFPLPAVFSDAEAAPLLCAGAIGFRSLQLTGLTDGQILGLTGFGASGHLVLKMTRKLFPATKVIVFARSEEEQKFALSLDAAWAGQFADKPPYLAHAIIDTTPAWRPVVESMLHLRPGGRLVINAIRKEPSDMDALLSITYQQHLWMEKEIKTVANITRQDITDFLTLAASIPIRPEVELYPFEKANEALLDLKQKHVKGAKVLTMT